MRHWMLLAAWLAIAPLVRAQDVAMAVPLGDAQIKLSIPDGYLRASEAAPVFYKATTAAIPPTERVLEVMVAKADLKRMALGTGTQEPYLIVGSFRDAEAVDFTGEEFASLKPVLAKQMGMVDLAATLHEDEQQVGKGVGDAYGVDTRLKFGDPGKPQVYGDDPRALLFQMQVPIQADVGGRHVEKTINCAGALALVGGKLLLVYAYTQDQAGQSGLPATRDALGAYLQRVQALNATFAPGSAAQSTH